jgi:hypothetical protein
MKHLLSGIVFFLVSALIPVWSMAQQPVRHTLEVVVHPEGHRLDARDTITVPKGLSSDLTFLLHSGLGPSSPTPGVRVERETVRSQIPPLDSFSIKLPEGQRTFVLEYGGEIYHPPESHVKEYARGFIQTPGVISGEGIYLSGRSFWYPVFGEGLIVFSLTVDLPSMWNAVSQGTRAMFHRGEDGTAVRWDSPEPQDEIFLVAARFTEYRQHAGRVETMVFLRGPNEDLANKYLEATARYIAMYERLIGPYPYRKFALVENFWETGLGMPSFTLLGPKIIRFPFILHSSYPHEILHNWWGNGVFADYAKGNWAEGLTAYLADHLIKEQRGHGVAYRQETLQKYADYVLRGRDFPLTQFRSRHSSPSEAVGYGKSLMFFHMLRMELGDKAFAAGLQNFYQENRFQVASFDDLRDSFHALSGRDLRAPFAQWVTRSGAPEIQLKEARVEAHGDGYLLTVLLEQVQPGDAYRLRIPVAITMAGRERAFQTMAVMEKKRFEMKFPLPDRPTRVDVDPEFDLFRRLGREEIPPALTQAMGAKKIWILLPSSAGEGLLETYRGLAQSLSASGPDQVEVRFDSEFEDLPADGGVILLGWRNRYYGEIVSALSGYDVAMDRWAVRVGGIKLRREDHSVVVTARHPKDRNLSLTWIASEVPEALSGFGRKLPHYHKYSYLGFEGTEPVNVAKGRWPVSESPMTVFVPLEDGTAVKGEMGKLAPRVPLTMLPPVFSKEGMIETIRFLASEELGGRGSGTEGLDRAAAYISGRFQEAGLEPLGDAEGSYYQTWEDEGDESGLTAQMKNVVGVIRGERPDRAGQSVVVGAHYDHLGLGGPGGRTEHQGEIHPGADDNASGVAVLVELARVLGKSLKPDRSVVFVAFTGEETGRRGSRTYVADQKSYPPGQCIGMVNLDTVGRLDNGKLFVLGAGSAKEWIHIVQGAGYVTGVDLEAVAEDLDSSDQKSFHEAGVPAVQLFTGPHIDYHRPSDTVEKIDGEGLLKVASAAKEIVEYLAGREAFMTSMLAPGEKLEKGPEEGRTVSLGTIPDFAFDGEGYRLSGVVPGSPADRSGLRAGDVIVGIGSEAVHDLKSLSRVLKSLNPGDRILITFLRKGEKLTVDAKVLKK